MSKKKTFEEVKELFTKRNYILLEDTYINNGTKMEYICKKHPDNIQKIRVNTLIQGSGCKYCGIEKVHEITRLDFKTVKDAFNARGYILLETKYINNLTKMKYICKKHPDKENYTTYNSLQQNSGCPYCAGRKVDYTNCLATTHPQLIEEWSTTLNKESTPYNISRGSNTIVYWNCKSCSNVFSMSPNTRTSMNCGCPLCAKSKGEKKVRQWLEENNIKFEDQKEFDGLIGLGGRNLSYDFFLPMQNILIEYQGEYHDGTARNQTKEQFEYQKEHDKRKREYVEQHNIKLLEIWYWDFDNIEEILESEFKSLLNKQILV